MSGLDGLGWPNPEDEPKPTKSMNTDTPESDKAKIAFTSLFANDDAYWIPYTVGMRLERERDQWKANHDNQVALKAMLKERPDLGDKASRIADLIRELYEVRQERKNDWEKMHNLLNQADKRHQRARRQRDESREQRDRLAVVLQRIRDGYGGQVASPNCCEDCEFLIQIDEALATLNQPNL